MLNKLAKRMLNVVALGLLLVPTTSQAQDIPRLKEVQKSSILFDVRVSTAIEEAMQLGMTQEQIDSIPMDGPFEGIRLTEIKRIFGSMSLPESLDEVNRMMMGPRAKSPVDFFVRVEFADADVLDKMEAFTKKEFETVKLNGIEYYSAPGELLFAQRVGETTFEFATKDYILQKKRNFFTDRLKIAYKSAPDDPLRVVIDLESRGDLVKEVIEFGKSQIENPIGQAYLDLIGNAKSIVFTQGLGTDTLATLLVDGVDESKAEELKEGLASAFGTLSLVSRPMIMQMTQGMDLKEETGKTMSAMLTDLSAEREGTRVSVMVKKPKGFEAAMADFQVAATKMAKFTERMNGFRQLGLAAHNYEAVHMKFPFLVANGHNENISWRVKVLPYVDQGDIYDQCDLSKGPKEEPNSAFADKMPRLFGSDGKTTHVSWVQSKVLTFGSITDGSSNTIMLIENHNAGPWMENNPISLDDAMNLVANLEEGKDLIAVMYDGSCLVLDKDMDKENLRNMLDPRDGKRVNWLP